MSSSVNVFDDLSNESIIEIALNLSIREVTKLCGINRKFRNIISNNEYFWQQRCQRDYGIINPNRSWLNSYRLHQKVWIFGGEKTSKCSSYIR